MKALDKWDIRAFYLVKRMEDTFTLEDIKKLWEERCGLPVGTVKAKDLVRHFLPIVMEMHPHTGLWDILENSDPKSTRWASYRDENGPLPYWDMLLANIACKMVITPVVDIAGYREYIESLSINSDYKIHDFDVRGTISDDPITAGAEHLIMQVDKTS